MAKDITVQRLDEVTHMFNQRLAKSAIGMGAAGREELVIPEDIAQSPVALEKLTEAYNQAGFVANVEPRRDYHYLVVRRTVGM